MIFIKTTVMRIFDCKTEKPALSESKQDVTTTTNPLCITYELLSTRCCIEKIMWVHVKTDMFVCK